MRGERTAPAHPLSEIREAYIRALSRGVVPVKLAYLGNPREAERLMGLPSYQAITWSLPQEVDQVCSAAGSGGACSLADLGVGTGVHLVRLLAECGRRGVGVTRCLGIDLVPEFLAVARSRIERELPQIEFTSYEWDFEETRTEAIQKWRARSEFTGPLVLTLLGLTLGNVESPARVLRNIRKSCSRQDVLVVDVATARGSRHQMLEPYMSAAFEEATLAPFAAMGFPTDGFRTKVWWEEGSIYSAVEVLQPVRIPDSGLVLVPGDGVVVFRSRRYSPGALARLAESTGWVFKRAPRVDELGHLTASLSPA